MIDFRVLARDGVTAEAFSRAGARLGDRYPRVEPMRSIEAKFGVQKGRSVAPVQSESDVGRMLRAADDKTRAQFRVDGFTFNKLKPYTTWGDVFGNALSLWQTYVELAEPREISRLAVRYINRLLLPVPVQFSDYLEASPPVPSGVPQQISEFLSRIVVHDTEREISAAITQALEGRVDPGQISVLLDIDAFRAGSVSPNDSDVIRTIFEDLRALKNDIFFASITERLVEQYV